MSPLNLGTARMTAVAALAVAVLYAVSIPIGSLASAPATDAAPAAVAGFFTAHRDGILTAVVLNGIAWCALMPAVFVGLRRVIGAEGREAMNVAVIGAGVESALIGVILVLAGTAAYSTPALSAASAKLLSDGYALATVASSWPTLTCVLGLVLAVRRTRALPASVVVLGLAVAAAHGFASVAVARGGAFSASGIAVAAPMLFAAWLALIGAVLLRGATRGLVAQPAAA